jgi:mannose-6-phosphate isomerase-like protein (cupin superfamily)
MTKPYNLETTPLHFSRDSVVAVPDFGGDYDRYIAKYCTDGDVGRLAQLYKSEADWGMWETHPAGDEVVIVMSGRAEFIQRIDGVERRVVVGPGEAIINPPGVAHTANVVEPFLALYITPGPGTFHEPR